MTRIPALIACLLLVLIGHALILPLAAWRALREGVARGSRASDAALLWDLCIARLLGAEPGETVSTWAQRVKPSRWACVLCRLLSVRWPAHCEDSGGVLFNIVRSRRSAKD